MDDPKPGLKWDLTVSLGNIVSVVALLLTVGGLILTANRYFATTDGRIVALEGSVASLRQAIGASDARNREADAETRVGIRRVDDKLTALLIQGYQRGANVAPTPLRE